MPATELRVHLGEALRALEDEDLIIEKGGVPVAILTKYESVSAMAGTVGADLEYERSLSHRREPDGIERMFRAMELGWVGLDGDKLVRDIYRRRDEGTSDKHYSLSEAEQTSDKRREVPPGQRRANRRAQQPARVADRRKPYRA